MTQPSQAQSEKQVLDADCSDGGSVNNSGVDDLRIAQTFTALGTGKLTKAEVVVDKPDGSGGDFVMEIREADAQGPKDAVLATTTIPASAVPDAKTTLTGTFSEAATVVAGRQYALVVRLPAKGTSFAIRTNNPCPGNFSFDTDGSAPFTSGASLDLVFATYLDAFTVNSTGDGLDANTADGACDSDLTTAGTQCTLTAAIQTANIEAGADRIHFAIPGAGVKTISSSSGMPRITDAVTIDGYTQFGASENTLSKGTNAMLLVELKGSTTNTGLDIRAADTVVRGLVINRYLNGIFVDGLGGATGVRIEGNFIGTDATGTTTDPDGAPNSGDELGNGQRGIGITNGASNNTVGGAAPAARNLISGNVLDGLSIQGNAACNTINNKVEGNLIGTSKDATSPLGTTLNGVSIFNSSGNTVGGAPSAGAANTIAFGRGEGIRATGSCSTGNRILGNSIFSNARLGIDLVSGANNLQSSPAIASARTSNTKGTTVKGTLESTPGQAFTMQFFSNPSSTKEEGKTFVGEKTFIDDDGDGVVTFAFKPSRKVKPNLFVTATATNEATGDTSEFSAPKRVVQIR